MNATAPVGEKPFCAADNTNVGGTAQGTLAELVSGIVADAQTLIRQQFTMLKAEVREDVCRATQAGKLLGIGAACGVVGGLFLGVGVVHLLAWLFPTLPLWACWALVGGVLFVGGVSAAIAGRQRLETGVTPQKSLHALQENISWITNRQTASNAT